MRADVLRALSAAFERAGFRVVTGDADEARSGMLDVAAMVARYRADAIVYDVSPPPADEAPARDERLLNNAVWLITTTRANEGPQASVRRFEAPVDVDVFVELVRGV